MIRVRSQLLLQLALGISAVANAKQHSVANNAGDENDNLSGSCDFRESRVIGYSDPKSRPGRGRRGAGLAFALRCASGGAATGRSCGLSNERR